MDGTIPPRRGPGQPPHVPTDRTRQHVAVLRANGVPVRIIAEMLGISHQTLRDSLQAGIAQWRREGESGDRHVAGEGGARRQRARAEVLAAKHVAARIGASSKVARSACRRLKKLRC